MCAPVALADGKPRLTSDGVEASNRKLLSLDTRRRIFFKYERRIRDMSTLVKTYEYFATQTDATGAKAMDVRDVVRAVVPTYPASDTNVERAGFLDGERGQRVKGGVMNEPRDSVFRVLDDDGDGLISFPEFRLVVLLLSIPDADVKVVFSVLDLDDSGAIDADEFDVILTELERRAGIQPNFHARPGKHDSTGGAAKQGPGNVARALFGSDLKKQLDLKRFKAFLNQLHSDMVRLEFAHYDSNGDGRIRGIDFANSIAAAADLTRVDEFLDKAAAMGPELQDAQITFKDFSSLAYIRRHLHRLTFALEFCHRMGRPVEKADFSKLTQRLLNVKLSQQVVDIIFAVCGDKQGRLDTHEFIRLMRHRERGPGRKSGHLSGASGEGGAMGGLGRTWRCIKECFADPDDRLVESPDD